MRPRLALVGNDLLCKGIRIECETHRPEEIHIAEFSDIDDLRAGLDAGLIYEGFILSFYRWIDRRPVPVAEELIALILSRKPSALIAIRADREDQEVQRVRRELEGDNITVIVPSRDADFRETRRFLHRILHEDDATVPA